MKNFKLVFLLLAMVSFSCSNVDFVNDDVNADSEVLLAENDFSLKSTEKLTAGNSFRLRNGTQEINDNQTDDQLQRGVGVSIPLFVNQRDPVEVPMGSWVTLRFGLQDLLSPEDCPEILSEEQVNNIRLSSQEWIDSNNVSITFNGEEIDMVPSFFRLDNINLVYGIGPEGPGCYTQVPWRYYVNPQAKGDYTFSFIVDGVEYSRTISWVPGNE